MGRFDFVIRDESAIISDAPREAKLLLGKDAFRYCGEDVIFLSPSVRRERREILALEEKGAFLSSDAELFFEKKPKNVLAITGSDGKSTTSALTGAILSEAEKAVHVCGNYGLPLTPLLENGEEFFVTELSSFMLRYMKPHSRRAVITNLTPNHLNWHESYEEYVAAKLGIYENTDEAVLCAELGVKVGREVFAVFSDKKPFCELRQGYRAEVYYTLEDGEIKRNGERLFSRSEIRLSGTHNVKNALAALSLTDGLADKGAAVRAIRAFRGLAHRMELVGVLDGQRFYDSSIDSTPDRTRVTLLAHGAPFSVILGGRGKGLSYAPIADALREEALGAVLFGENAGELYGFLLEAGLECPLVFARDMDEAVAVARDFGGDVILSPGATSYDRYANFEERGRDFARAVRELK